MRRDPAVCAGAPLILLAKPLTYAVPLMPVAPQKPRANS